MTDEERFQYALNEVLKDEGGFTDDPDDPGGATNFGITQKNLDTYREENPKIGVPYKVQDLMHYEADQYYKKLWWNKYNYNAIKSIQIAAKIFDLAVNMGAIQAHKLVQRALYFSGYRVNVDGVLGTKTLAAINDMCNTGQESDLDYEIKQEALFFYENLVKENPRLVKFLHGWINRAEE